MDRVYRGTAGISRLTCIVSQLIAVVLLLALVGCSSDEGEAETEASTTSVSSAGDAPDFTLRTLDGDTVRLSSLKGKVVILDFWATWCPPCRVTLPLMNKVYEKTRGKDVEVFGVSTDRGPSSKVRSFVESNNISMPILLDSESEASSAYGIRAIPTMFIIDQKGNIHEKHIGGDP
ncbi:MAG: TlpA family protein disulfide reductase, partial [Candidatus Coatesbacteria bacterium]|nr:TlpA family protein disulfide reductase [Candidatus Coatesbacteria bacterium]